MVPYSHNKRVVSYRIIQISLKRPTAKSVLYGSKTIMNNTIFSKMVIKRWQYLSQLADHSGMLDWLTNFWESDCSQSYCFCIMFANTIVLNSVIQSFLCKTHHFPWIFHTSNIFFEQGWSIGLIFFSFFLASNPVVALKIIVSGFVIN